MASQLAHDFNAAPRTSDVRLIDDIEFSDMFFSERIYKGLKENGFKKPSPIQYKAIPLARCGLDLIVQSKSGTGKTLVFVLTTLEVIDTSVDRVQAIVLTPTREIALQASNVYTAIGSHINDLKIKTFIGGLPLHNDISAASKCHVALGAPGRIKQLIELGHLKTDAVRLFILDEADQLMGKSFQSDINFIYWKLCESKQMIAVSATYPDELVKFLSRYLRMGKHVTPDTDPLPVLRGISQFAYVTRSHPDKLARLKDKEQALLMLLGNIKFNQCIIFTNYQSRGESICNLMKENGWVAGWVCGSQTQEKRLTAINGWTQGTFRILVSTDLTSRGIDSKGVDLVINIDAPWDPSVYLHRMGRAARYGTHGIVVTILSEGHDVIGFRKMLGLIAGDSLYVLKIPNQMNDFDIWSCDKTKLKKMYGLPPEKNVGDDENTKRESNAVYASKHGKDGNLSACDKVGNKSKSTTEEEVSKYGTEYSNKSSSCDLKSSDFPCLVKEDYSSIPHVQNQRKSSYSDAVKDKETERPRKRSYNESLDDTVTYSESKIQQCKLSFVDIVKGEESKSESCSRKGSLVTDLNSYFTQAEDITPISFTEILNSFKNFNDKVKHSESKENIKKDHKDIRRVKGKLVKPIEKEGPDLFEFKAKPMEDCPKEHQHKKAKVLTESSICNAVSPRKSSILSPRKSRKDRLSHGEKTNLVDSRPSENLPAVTISIDIESCKKRLGVEPSSNGEELKPNGKQKSLNSIVTQAKQMTESKISKLKSSKCDEPAMATSTQSEDAEIKKSEPESVKAETLKCASSQCSEGTLDRVQLIEVHSNGASYSRGSSFPPKQGGRMSGPADSQCAKVKFESSSCPSKIVRNASKPVQVTHSPLSSSEDDQYNTSSASEGSYILSQSYTNSASKNKVRPAESHHRYRNTAPKFTYEDWCKMFQYQHWHIMNYSLNINKL